MPGEITEFDPKRFSRLRIIQKITEAAGATHTIETHGTRVDPLAKAVHELAPIARLWYKDFVDQSRIVKMSLFLDRWWDFQ